MSASLLITAEAYGRRVGLTMPASIVDDVRPLLPFWWNDADVEPEKTWDMPSVDVIALTLSLMELWVGEHSEDFIFVHAGVVSFGDHALVLPGRSMSGKTTLVTLLLELGGRYLSDEYALFDPDGLVSPYPRRLRVRAGTDRKHVDADAYGSEPDIRRLPVGALWTLTYRSDGGHDYAQVSRASTVLSLVENTLAARSRPEKYLPRFAKAVQSAVCMGGDRGHLGPDQLRALLLLSGLVSVS